MRNYPDQDGFVTVINRRKQNRPPNYWSKLPREIIIMILQKVGTLPILLSARLVCTQWREICTDPSMWATIRVVDWLSYWNPQKLTYYEYRTHVENMIRWAVDQSCGSLFDLDLDKLMSDELLYYVVERCNRIRRLRGGTMHYIVDVLERVASRLPLLEDFELVGDHELWSEAIETLGRYCPKLTSLKIPIYDDEVAKTIARSMPQLRHISVPGKSFVTYMGVKALLDGCPHLESLDIGGCYFVETTGACQMMKNLPLTRTQWRCVLEDPSTWSTICVGRGILTFTSFHNCEEFKYIIRQAVDNSCGGLVDLDLDEYMSGDILDYVVERCTRIRRLHGYIRSYYSEETLRAALAKLPLLEDLSFRNEVSAETIETLVRCCPRLTSLEIPIYDDDEAERLARSFPQLRHLKPFDGYQLTDAGVEAILDGCPNLESLDLLECDSVTVYGTLGIRCAQKIKYFQRPSALDHPYYCWSFCGSTKKYQIYEDDLDDNQFLEEVVYDVDYTIHRREEYWSRREKARSKETQQLRRVKGNKNRRNIDTRGSKARRIRESRRDSRREVKKDFVHLNKLLTGPLYCQENGVRIICRLMKKMV